MPSTQRGTNPTESQATAQVKPIPIAPRMRRSHFGMIVSGSMTLPRYSDLLPTRGPAGREGLVLFRSWAAGVRRGLAAPRVCADAVGPRSLLSELRPRGPRLDADET